MATAIILATQKPIYLTTGMVTASSGTYDAAVPTATAPANTTQGVLIPTGLGDQPSLMRCLTR